MMYGFGGMGLFGGLGMVLFLGLFVWLIVWLVNKNKEPEKKENPSQILKERYAKGELTKKKYETMREELRR